MGDWEYLQSDLGYCEGDGKYYVRAAHNPYISPLISIYKSSYHKLLTEAIELCSKLVEGRITSIQDEKQILEK